jgi:hypothetical protein
MARQLLRAGRWAALVEPARRFLAVNWRQRQQPARRFLAVNWVPSSPTSPALPRGELDRRRQQPAGRFLAVYLIAVVSSLPGELATRRGAGIPEINNRKT